jgi:hypothetical protein
MNLLLSKKRRSTVFSITTASTKNQPDDKDSVSPEEQQHELVGYRKRQQTHEQ